MKRRLLLYTPYVEASDRRITEAILSGLAQLGAEDWEFTVLGQKYDSGSHEIDYSGLDTLWIDGELPIPRNHNYQIEHSKRYAHSLFQRAYKYDLIYSPNITWSMAGEWETSTPLVTSIFNFDFETSPDVLWKEYAWEITWRIAERSALTLFPSLMACQHAEQEYRFDATQVLYHVLPRKALGLFQPEPLPESVLPDHYFLTVDTFGALAAEVLAGRARELWDDPDLPPLVITGANTHDERFGQQWETVQKAARLAYTQHGDVYIMGELSDGNLRFLIEHADALIVPNHSATALDPVVYYAQTLKRPALIGASVPLIEQMDDHIYPFVYQLGNSKALAETIHDFRNRVKAGTLVPVLAEFPVLTPLNMAEHYLIAFEKSLSKEKIR